MTNFIKTPIGYVAKRPLNIEDTGVKELLKKSGYPENVVLKDGTITQSPIILQAMAQELRYSPLSIRDICTLADSNNPKVYHLLFKESEDEIRFNVLSETIVPGKNQGQLEVLTNGKFEYENGLWQLVDPEKRVIPFPPKGTPQSDTITLLFDSENLDEGGFPEEYNPNGRFRLIYPQRDKPHALCQIGDEIYTERINASPNFELRSHFTLIPKKL
ncbi:MAG: hypothetical protein ABH840_02545 [Nanoarchaeota archaeon]